MRIENNFEQLGRGRYAVVTQMNGGTGFDLQISIDNGPFITIVGGSFTTDATNVIDIPECRIRGVSAGGAFADVNLIEGGFY